MEAGLPNSPAGGAPPNPRFFANVFVIENEAATQARNRALADYQRKVRQNISDRHALRKQMQANAQAATADRLAEIEALRAAQNYDIGTKYPMRGMFYDNEGLENLGREESTESIRQRYFDSFNERAFGGNARQYQLETCAIEGVGAVEVTPI